MQNDTEAIRREFTDFVLAHRPWGTAAEWDLSAAFAALSSADTPVEEAYNYVFGGGGGIPEGLFADPDNINLVVISQHEFLFGVWLGSRLAKASLVGERP